MTDNTNLLAALREGATLITPNNRLSNEILKDFFKATLRPVQEKPHCLPYNSFLQDSFKKHCLVQAQKDHPLLLSTQQSRYLWRQILIQSTQQVNEGLLQAVEEAWIRCQCWQVDFEHPSFATNIQTRQFQRWALQYQAELDRLGALTQEQLANYLLRERFILETKELIWVCFDNYTPQQQALQHYLTLQGYPQHYYDLEAHEAQLFSYVAKDERDEYQQLLSWLKECLARGEKRIAVVVPNLESEAKALQRLLQQEIAREQFNISFGQALASYPLVAHALAWLNLDNALISVQQARLVLHSPYLAGSQREMLARLQFMEESPLLQELYFSKAQFLKTLKITAPKLAESLQKIETYPEKASPKKWSLVFKARLKILGFPGEYQLDSSAYQCYQRFFGIFDEFEHLSLVKPLMTKEEALSAFDELAKTTIFQAKQAAAPIQILGLLEASGCRFDSLWFCGLSDQCLPGKARLSAFIPLSLQREYLMPHASPARELQLAQTALTRFKRSSNTLVFSYPLLNGGQPNLASPLIESLPALNTFSIKPRKEAITMEKVSEDYLLSFIAQEKTAGGTAILANQAKCPFRAFAAHRLHAKPMNETSDGPDAKERGQLIHKVMELLWQNLQSQKNLLALSTDELEQRIEQAIQEALTPLISQRNYSFSALPQAVELERLKRLVHACLQWERQRPPFEIEALEQAYTINLSGLEFRVRVDRLDKLDTGKKWVIDYKSSLPSTLPWKEERPKEPQLLLYALLDETINTLLFTQLKNGQLSCKGFSEEKQNLSGISNPKKDENWLDYRQHWQSQLQELAEEFSKGHCPPQPITTSICQQCDYQNLCRFAVDS